MRRSSRKGSALVGVIWLLAVLSILIASYAVDAHLQTRINLYLRERITVDHLTDAGLAIAEVILTDYQNVSEASSEKAYYEMLEDDRWYAEKLMLKAQQPRCLKLFSRLITRITATTSIYGWNTNTGSNTGSRWVP